MNESSSDDKPVSSANKNFSFLGILEGVACVAQNLDALSELCLPFSMEDEACDPDDYVPKIQSKGDEKNEFEYNNEISDVNAVGRSLTSIKVQCLQSIDSLKEICENQGLKFSTCLSNETYEIDMIYGHEVIDNEMRYFVKWKNYESQYNTWEPACNLTGCQELTQYYDVLQGPEAKIDKKLLMFFVEDLITRNPCDILTMIKVTAFCLGQSEEYVRSLNLNLSNLKSKVRQLLKFSNERLGYKSNQETLLSLMKFRESRKHVLIELQEWEEDINSFMPENSTYIEVENNEDLETAPKDFQFFHDYINTINTPKLEEPITFCNCKNCFKEKDCCCPKDSEGKFAYNKHKLLILQPGYPIFECNNKCHCSEKCTNRVVQNGSKIKVAIFRTSNGTGWGLKSLQTIEKGQFVLEYIGEIITSEVAEERGNIYDYVRRSYLFDLDYRTDVTSYYTVDAGHFGNAAHFINHSCNPNLHVFAVWINVQDPSMPRLALFAKRKIYKGEELTFDYKMKRDSFNHANSSGDSVRVPCECNSFNCRKFLF